MPSRSQRKFNNLYTHQHLYNNNQPLTNNSPNFFLGGRYYDPVLMSDMYKINYVENKFTPLFVPKPNINDNVISTSSELNTDLVSNATPNLESNTNIQVVRNPVPIVRNHVPIVRNPVPIVHGNPKYYATKYTSGLTSGKMFKKVR